MKKALSLLLAGVMCVGLLAGCGGQNTEDTQGSDSTPDTSSTQETGNKTIDNRHPANRLRPLPGAGRDHHRHRAPEADAH